MKEIKDLQAITSINKCFFMSENQFWETNLGSFDLFV